MNCLAPKIEFDWLVPKPKPWVGWLVLKFWLLDTDLLFTESSLQADERFRFSFEESINKKKMELNICTSEWAFLTPDIYKQLQSNSHSRNSSLVLGWDGKSEQIKKTLRIFECMECFCFKIKRWKNMLAYTL